MQCLNKITNAIVFRNPEITFSKFPKPLQAKLPEADTLIRNRCEIL